MIRSSTLQLLRFPFSFFLMPVYWLSLSQCENIVTANAIAVFIILHLFVYPASNGYNSYMNKDQDSIGGIKNPQQPTKQLFYTSVILDLLALSASLFISIYFFWGILAFIAASRAYSYRGIRLKRFPVIGYLTVIIFQGALVFFLVMHGSSADNPLQVPLAGMVAASLLVGGIYPLTQIYQHMQDKADGVLTLSYKLGYRGTFIFTAVVYTLAMAVLALFLALNLEFDSFLIIQIFLLPVAVYFIWWFYKVYHDVSQANFINSLRMNVIAALCTNAAFIFLFLTEKY